MNESSSQSLHPDSDPLKFRLKNNLIIVDAAVNGTGVSMILDTGAGATIVSNELAERLELQRIGKSCDGLGAGGGVQMEVVGIDSLLIGDVCLRNMEPMSTDLSAICDRLDEKIDGVIGFDFLRHTRLSIDYAAQELVLQSGQEPNQSVAKSRPI